MTSRSRGHAEKSGPPSSKPPAAPKLQVQRSLSRENITIHFSAFGKEEEEEEVELYGAAASSSAPDDFDDQSIVTAVEASEDLQFDAGGLDPVDLTASANVSVSSSAQPPVSAGPAAGVPQSPGPLRSSPALSILSSPSSHAGSSAGPASSSWPSEQKPPAAAPAAAASSSSSTSSPSKSIALSSGAKPFLSLVKSLSTEVEPKDSTTSLRHRHLMKTLVKSLSTDTSRQDTDSTSSRPPDSRLNLHLFKQFTQPRVTSAGDSKTAPSSPLTSPDSRSFFKVPEVEARIEDTKRRLSEVIYEPLQLLSKIMGDEGGAGGHRHKALSSSASELSSLAGLNGHLESNNNYSIKEEEFDSEGEYLLGDSTPDRRESTAGVPEPAKDAADAKSSPATGTREARSLPLVLEKCSLSALAKQEDEEFCELYSEDFEVCTDTETDGDKPEEAVLEAALTQGDSTGVCSEDELDDDVPAPSVPSKTLFVLITLLYGYFVLPLPTYVCGMLLGAAAGFLIAIGVVWLSTPRGSGYQRRHTKRKDCLWNVAHLDIKEPDLFKGWMNEICNYDPETYHATLTHSVFVRLEGCTLRLSKPNRNISRRASFNEPKPDVTYISQKIYDLTDSKIYLVPPSLARKRVWNKKYPICIELGKQEDFMSKAQGDRDRESGEERGEAGGEDGRAPAHRDQTLFLFGRTGREKEEWFRRILLAAKLKSEAKKTPSLPGTKAAFLPSHSRSSSKGSVDEALPQPRPKEPSASVRQKMLLDYTVYMAKYVPPQPGSPAASPLHSADSSPSTSKKLPGGQGEAEEPEAWVNALLGRIFWDFLGEKYWADLVSKKIQMKLSKIRLPYFMNELTLTELDMGVAVPKILQASKPSVDHQGLWFDLEISYNGSFLMTLETKMNLTRLGKEPLGEGLRFGETGKEGARPRTYCLADSDEESSSAGSSDEEDPPEVTAADKSLVPGAEGYVGGHRASKIMRFVDKITKSKYFQKATETEFIKKKIEEVSNTPLLLTVEVQECRGTLAVNIPPPPTDRVWYGFRSPPHLELKARPKLGEREVTLAHVTDWIEKKLDQEFQKIFVMPNMDDLYVPIMHSAMDARSQAALAPAADPPRDQGEAEPCAEGQM
uniref:Testis expressed 2 n=1 Tax=Lepisosteus oculatus TaxID=7918 RepID=W5N8D3_LEPOC|nr:PREDICTED: testis-expressed sequence 2 protein isoform X1 [Lepisosteus oculatus]XP_015211879.1 PREDICTED: testis-expressed sequence 2 protein isoform X1 [Lepisosteus oculatus]